MFTICTFQFLCSNIYMLQKSSKMHLYILYSIYCKMSTADTNDINFYNTSELQNEVNGRLIRASEILLIIYLFIQNKLCGHFSIVCRLHDGGLFRICIMYVWIWNMGTKFFKFNVSPSFGSVMHYTINFILFLLFLFTEVEFKKCLKIYIFFFSCKYKI